VSGSWYSTPLSLFGRSRWVATLMCNVMLGSESLCRMTDTRALLRAGPVNTTLSRYDNYMAGLFSFLDPCFVYFFLIRAGVDGGCYTTGKERKGIRGWGRYRHEVMVSLPIYIVRVFFLLWSLGCGCAHAMRCILLCEKISHTHLSYCYYYRSIVSSSQNNFYLLLVFSEGAASSCTPVRACR
jgi:hypothetical protein